MTVKSKPGPAWLSTICLSAIAVRYCLMYSKYQKIVADHVEVSTPLNSWKRVLEGLFLISKDISPYNGDLLHETPLMLQVYKFLLEIFMHKTEIMFISLDLWTGIILYFTTKKFIQTTYKLDESRKNKFANDIEEYLITESHIIKAPMYVILAYLFNPFTVLNCIGCSTAVIFYFILSLFLCSMVYGNCILSGSFLALCTSIALYPIILVFPLALYFLNIHHSSVKTFVSTFSFLATLCAVHLYSYNCDSNYFKNVYGFILTVPDLQPNIGLFWYFFTEMFDHFRDLFIYSFQINATILYLIPLSLKFRKEPYILTFALLFLITIFKSYPSIGDVGFVLSLLPSFIYLFAFCQQGFLVSVIYLITSTLAPILWHLWIYCNSANANFYFGVTLAFAIAQIFLITDMLFAQVKREFCLINGKERVIDGKEMHLSLE